MKKTALQRQSELSHEDYVKTEQAFRKLVRCKGCYRKGISKDDFNEADRLAELLGRKISDGWDEHLFIPPRPGSLAEIRMGNEIRHGTPHPQP